MAYKIVTNLVMLPLAASLFTFTKEYAEKAMLKREERSRWLHVLARVAEPRNAVIIVLVTAAIFGVSDLAEPRPRHRHPAARGAGAAARRPLQPRRGRHRRKYDMGLDWLTVVFEAPAGSDRNVAIGAFVDDFTWKMPNVPGVMSVDSYSKQLRPLQRGLQRGQPEDGGRPDRSRPTTRG